VVVELLERDTPGVEVAVPFGAQLFVSIVEVLRELLGNLLFARGRQPQRGKPWK
jgi:hypothetical protein